MLASPDMSSDADGGRTRLIVGDVPKVGTLNHGLPVSRRQKAGNRPRFGFRSFGEFPRRSAAAFSFA